MLDDQGEILSLQNQCSLADAAQEVDVIINEVPQVQTQTEMERRHTTLHTTLHTTPQRRRR